MSKMRPELSKKNKYWISKYRYYELKYFCLQYKEWKKIYSEIDNVKTNSIIKIQETFDYNDSTINIIEKRNSIYGKISLIEQAAINTDLSLYKYILKAVTENLSYVYLKTKLNIPCGKDMYYERYRKFFWILDKMKN